jgi:hypothetical protein
MKALLFGTLYGFGGAFVGFILFVVFIRLDWLADPGGGMALFPLVFLPAVGFGAYGFARGLRKQQTTSN